jgi:hypothetical protein
MAASPSNQSQNVQRGVLRDAPLYVVPSPKNKPVNMQKSCPSFRQLFAVTFSHTFHHNFTTITTQKTVVCTPVFAKTPAKTVLHHNQKKS